MLALSSAGISDLRKQTAPTYTAVTRKIVTHHNRPISTPAPSIAFTLEEQSDIP